MTTPIRLSPLDFMSAAPAPLGGNSPWAARYAGELKRVVMEAAARAPRSLQLHLGPSELGVNCDRQVAGKMAGVATTNHVSDPWPSIMGTAGHMWMENAFTADNDRTGVLRWITEQRVTPHPNHPGTADLYDAVERVLGDHKFLGDSTMAKVRKASGPPRKYVVQMLLYARGYRLLGLPVDRVALIAWPRTGSSLDGMYVWERQHTPADNIIIDEVFQQTEIRQEYAKQIHSGRLSLSDIPHKPDDDECYFCPFYRPQSGRDNGPGCPGTTAP